MFLVPRCYRPEKINFAGKYEQLSRDAEGHIFTLSGQRARNLQIASFSFHAQSDSKSFLVRNLRRFWIQAILPAVLLWKGPRVDAVIAYDPFSSGLAGVILKVVLRTRLIVEINGDYHRMDFSKGLAKRWVGKRVFWQCVKRCDALKVVNKDQEHFYRRRFPDKAVYRFPDYVASKYFSSLETYQGDYLLSVGHPFGLKGVDILIKSFTRITNRNNKMKLRIMGYCPEGEMAVYKNLARDNPKIEFVKAGWIEDVAEQMRGCYAVVSASRTEAASRIMFEAMASKKAIVATKTNSGMNYVEDNCTGLLVEINDADDLANKLEYLVNNPERAHEMGMAGFKKLIKDYSEKKYLQSFVHMVEQICQS
ncbi:MAG: glycosyltransferase family 4 protein [Bacteroidota bacterium]